MAGEVITTSGTFTQPATAVTNVLNLRYSPDWLRVINLTQARAATTTTNLGIAYEWWAYMGNDNLITMRGLTGTTGITSTTTTTMASTNGVPSVVYVDTSFPIINPIQTATVVTVGYPTVITVPTTAGFYVGGTVRLTANTAAALAGQVLQLAGLDFTVTAVNANGTQFTIGYMPQLGASNNSIGVQFLGYPALTGFQPRNKYIVAMRAEPTNLAQTTITFSTTHGYSVGQELRLYVPAVPQNPGYYSNIPLNGVEATVVAVGIADVSGITNTVTVNMSSALFGTFLFPTTAIAGAVNYQWAYAVAFGEDTAVAEGLHAPILQDSVIDDNMIGLILPVGPRSPGGQAGDVMLWMAGTAGLPND